MGHKPWDRAWKRVEKAKAKREWLKGIKAEFYPGVHWVHDVSADPNVLPPSAAIVAPRTKDLDDS